MANPHPKPHFKKGQSGNPKGRPPKGYSVTEMIRSMMDQEPELKKSLGKKIIGMALKGDITAIKMIWNYMDGMPLQKTDVTSDGEKITGPTVYIPKEKDG